MNPYQLWLKKFILALLILTLLILAPLFAFNYAVDPLWNFSNSNSYNQIQQAFDERQQKVNRIHYSKEKYDGILLGSSRGTYMDQHAFEDLNIFNFSVSSMLPDEYQGYLDYAKKKNGGEFDYVFLGLDFFATNQDRRLAADKPDFYINQSESYLYRIKSTLSLDTLKKSLISYHSSVKGKPDFVDHRYYDRENRAYPFPFDEEVLQKRIQTHMLKFYEEKESYAYDPKMKEIWEELKRDNPNTKFIVFTTPVTHPRLEAEMSRPERQKGYNQWLTDVTAVFGKVYHFMEVNKLTLKEENFMDSHHFLPEIGNLMIDDFWNHRDKKPVYARLLTKQTIEADLQAIHTERKQYEDKAFAFLKPVNSPDEPDFTYSFKKEAANQSHELAQIIQPMKVIGQRGQIEATRTKDGLLLKAPDYKKGKPFSIRIAMDAGSAFTKKDKEGATLSTIITVKGDGNSNALLFTQEQRGEKWIQQTYRLSHDSLHKRAFKLELPIKSFYYNILTGISWQPRSAEDWLLIEQVQLYYQ